MQPNFISVPFKIDDNLSQISGIGKFSRAGIVLEYESKLFGIIKNGVKETRISLDQILDVKFKKGLFKRGAKIEIRLKSFSQLSEVPNRDGRIALKLERDDFERGFEAVEKLTAAMNDETVKLSELHSPVSRLFDESEDETKELE